MRNLNIGLSGYVGKSQSKLYGKLPGDNTALKMRADSSTVGIAIIGADARYKLKGLEMRGQFYYTAISNTMEYNSFTRTGNTNNDLGKSMMGYYFETGYNIFRLFENIDQELIPFIRYEFYNTHSGVDASTTVKPAYKNTIITAGLTYNIRSGEKLNYTVYIGRVNSCRTGGCSSPQAVHKDNEYEFFDYFILFDPNGKAVSVRVFNYEATHGQEITIKGWLKQFYGYDGTKNLRVGKEIDSISGATISVYGIVNDIRLKTILLTHVRFHF